MKKILFILLITIICVLNLNAQRSSCSQGKKIKPSSPTENYQKRKEYKARKRKRALALYNMACYGHHHPGTLPPRKPRTKW